ncbi:MAG: hypothetical protein ACJ736_16755 [Streptomyces sp.]
MATCTGQQGDIAGGVGHTLVAAAGEKDQVDLVHAGRRSFGEGLAESLGGTGQG